MPKDEMFNGLDDDQILDVFNEIFYKELDSWFSADIACCDHCYDDFINKWPAANNRNYIFQRNSISVKGFYSGSKLSRFFTEEEFDRYIQHINCPNCGNPLIYNMWPYNLEFDLPDNIDKILQEINDIANMSPFILLSHPFALSIFDEIQQLGKNTTKKFINKCLYRARSYEVDKKFTGDDFKYPPRYKIVEGRFNHAGMPVLYLADDVETCFCELRKPANGIAFAEIKIKNSLKILDLFDIKNDYNSLLNVAAWSSLMSSPEEGDGWYKPQYIFTRFVADCAVAAGFDGIKYPSVRRNSKCNIVLLNGLTAWDNIAILDINTMMAKSCNESLHRQIYQ